MEKERIRTKGNAEEQTEWRRRIKEKTEWI